MKKIIFTLVMLLSVAAVNAQVTLTGSKTTDNWSITLKGGAVSPFQHYAFWPSSRGIFGAELRKQVTPVLGLGVEGEWTINTSSWDKQVPTWGMHSATMIDHQLVGGFATINFANMLFGYKGYPRTLDVDGVIGSGWWHAYKTGEIEGHKLADQNSWYTKAGVNVNLNLGQSKAWTVSLKPAVVWYMGKGATQATSSFNANNAWVEMEAGLTYHFGNSNGEHYMTLCDKRYTQDDIDALNDEINRLRSREPETRIVEKVVEKVVEKPVEVEKVKEIAGINTESLIINVYYTVGKSNVAADQQPNVERVASFLKSHSDATVTVRGYASPEGSKELNERLANERAASVKNPLVNKYGIKASRIDAKGMGVGDFFSEPSWNRVSVCRIIVSD
jgi:outer membrane protein OmpA-like peptidoglycan-associated protein